MKRTTVLLRRHVCCAAFVVFAVAGSQVGAQTTAPGSTTPASAAPSSAVAAAAEDEEIIELSPFVVEAAEDAGSYTATATLAGSRIRTELKDVGSAISVVTGQFLQDTGATNNETLLVYTTNTEVAGLGGNYSSVGNGRNLDDTAQRMAPHQSTRVRGLGQADNTRDFFLTDIPWDSYNVGRVDLQRGPNAILFGIGRPAGIVNSSLNAAGFRDGGNIEGRFGSFGSYRASLDYNKVVMEDELSLRVAALHDNTKYQQKPAYNRDRRYFMALRWDPKFLRFEGGRTSLRMNYENGTIDANRPRILPPGDLISPWWTRASLAAIRTRGGMNTQTLGLSDATTIAALRAAGDLGAGVRGNNSSYYNQAIGSFGRNYGGILSVFADPNSSNHTLITADIPKNVTSVLSSLPWTIMSGVIVRRELEGVLKEKANYDFYRDDSIQDASIFDFNHKLLDGPNKAEWSKHEAFNAALSQTFLNNRMGLEAVFDKQNYERGQVNLMSEYGQAITIDMNNRLIDGSINPNYGKACVVSDQFANYGFYSDRESQRLTGFGEFRAEETFGENFFSKLLGRHVLTGLWSSEDYFSEGRSWFRNAADIAYGINVLSGDRGLRNRSVNTLNYLTTASIAGLTSLQGANIGSLQVKQTPKSGSVKSFDMTWTATGVAQTSPWTDQFGTVKTQRENPANYRGWAGSPIGIDIISDDAGDRNSLTTDANLRRVVTDSYAGNWQAYMWDGILVPSFGIRHDKQKSYALPASNLPKNADGSDTVDLYSSNYKLPSTPSQVVSGRTESYSVVLHTPASIKEKMPWHSSVSLFWNKSANFQPSAGRIDVYGNSLPSPEGKTKDYGFVLTTWDDKVSFKVNWYETTVKNDALDNFGGTYMIWGAEAWAYGFARGNLLRANVGGWADFRNGYDPQGIVAGATPTGGWTPAQIATAQQVGDAICNAYMATKLPQSWFDLWGINTASADAGNFIWGTTPSGLTITGDTRSKGTEFEINAQPTKNWNIAVNASKTTAQRVNMAGSFVDWVETRWAVYNTPVTLNGQQITLHTPAADGGDRPAVIGDVRFWNGGYGPNETLKGKFGREFMSGYYLYRIQEGSDVPELRPWRYNIVTNYSFSEGRLKGFNVGGGYRWQDGVIVGYPVLPGATVNDPRAYDLGNPYKGPGETNIDLWVGFGKKLSEKLDWRCQLNVRNAFASKDLIPVTVQPTGELATGRIPEGTVWTLTNTLKF
jgi:hypothetical protein